MPKPYFQDLPNRVIDAVEKGGMSCRAAARRYEVSKSTAIKGLSATAARACVHRWAATVPRP